MHSGNPEQAVRPTVGQKVVLVTGATNGIGKATALELSSRGHRVLMTSRDATKGRRVLEEIKAQTANDALELYIGDLSSMSDVRRIALEVQAEHPTLDVLINNAGGVFNERRETVDGFEYTFAFNHLAYFLLTNLLLPSLKAAAEARGEARIVSLSSSAQAFGRLRWDDLEFKKNYSGWLSYGQSKLMNVVFATAVAQRLNGSGVSSNSVHPGRIASDFGNNLNGLNKLLLYLTPTLTPKQGAQTSVYLAASPEVRGVTGQYFIKQKPARANPVATNQQAQERLWALSETMLSRWLVSAERLAAGPGESGRS